MKQPMQIGYTVLLCCLFSGLGACTLDRDIHPPGVPVSDPAPRRILCLASEDLKTQGLDHIQAEALAVYAAAGYQLDFDYYQRVDLTRLSAYHAVIGMMPMLHAGTRAISEELGRDLATYIEQGGGFALLPAPSYYGVTDYVRQLNPFLAAFDIQLLNEAPRDPVHESVFPHIIAYRYLRTTQFADHPVTDGLVHLWLPLDYTDAYILTHTLAAGPDWNVVVRGEPTTATHPFEAVAAGRRDPGTYDQSPPLLALRPWGAGRMAVFTTSSQYFIFDAYHRAFQNGMVMQEGGERLMVQLLDWLTDTGYDPSDPEKDSHKAAPAHATGNVPVMPDRTAWWAYVTAEAQQRGYGVERYINCGSWRDMPWSGPRTQGYSGGRSEPVRWSWSELFHVTGANARQFGPEPLEYRFDQLPVGDDYLLGLLVWSPRAGAAHSIQVQAHPKAEPTVLAVPRMADEEGPAFYWLDVPAHQVTAEGQMTVTFSPAPGEGQAVAAINEIWVFRRNAQAGERNLLKPLVPESAMGHETPPPNSYFKGLIGVQALHPDSYPLADLAAAARAADLDFMVLLENAHALNPADWEALRAQCEALSDHTFRIIPGYTFEARAAGTARADQPQYRGEIQAYVFQQLQGLPEPDDYRQPYYLFWKLFGGELSGGRAAPPTLRMPGRNPITPYYQRFWRGIDLATTDEEGHLLDDARKDYAKWVEYGYGPQPRASGIYRTPDAIRAAAEEDWLTVIEAPRLAVVEPYHYTSSVSNGPALRDWQLSFDHSLGVGSGNGILFVDHPWLFVHARLHHAGGLRRVTLYDGKTALRRWHPNNTDWAIREPLRAGRNRSLWLHALGQDGRELYTGRIAVQENTFQLGMCGDNQNTIGNLTVAPHSFVRDERQIFQPHAYWHTGEASGQLGVMLNPALHVPRVIETGIIQPVKHFKPMPQFHFADGQYEDHHLAELRILSADRDHNRIEYRFEQPGCRARSRTVLTTFRPHAQGATWVLVESEFEALTDFELDADKGIGRLRVGLLPELAPAWRYAYRRYPDQALVAADFPYNHTGQWSLEDTLHPDHGVWFGPGDIASLLVVPLDDTAYALGLRLKASGRAREHMAFHELHGKHIARGERQTSRFLVLLQPADTIDREATELDRAVFLAHNPTHQLITTHCRLHPELPHHLAGQSVWVELEPGESRWLRITAQQFQLWPES